MKKSLEDLVRQDSQIVPSATRPCSFSNQSFRLVVQQKLPQESGSGKVCIQSVQASPATGVASSQVESLKLLSCSSVFAY